MSEYRSHVPSQEMVERQLELLKDEPLLLQYKPALLGQGQEQVVFEFPDHPDVVGKLPMYPMREIMLGSLV